MSSLPREAREGLMRAWLKVLSDRHHDVTWLPVSSGDEENEEITNGKEVNAT